MSDRSLERQRKELENLLALRAIEPLGAVDARRLDDLAAAAPAIDADGFDRAAAAVWLAATRENRAAMPHSLRQRIAFAADRQVRAERGDASGRDDATD